MSNPWNPEQYERFRDERSQPFFDLLEMVSPAPGGFAVDLGCGTGELTRLLHEKVGARETLGLDSSESMLAKSAAFAGGGLRFEMGSISEYQPDRPVDVLFSNAALQWVEHHELMFPRLLEMVAPGGQVAFQIPDNDEYVSHRLARAVAAQEPFVSAMGGYVRVWPVMEPEWYAELLDATGFAEQEVVLRVYGHHLESREGVVEWVKGTYLTDYQKRLAPDLYSKYLERYQERLFEELEDRQPFFYPYRRILIWGRKKAQ